MKTFLVRMTVYDSITDFPISLSSSLVVIRLPWFLQIILSSPFTDYYENVAFLSVTPVI